MATSTIVRAGLLARASWRGQLMLFLLGAALVATTIAVLPEVAGATVVALVLAIEVLVLLAGAVRAAAGGFLEFDGDLFASEFELLTPMLPRVVAHVTVCTAPSILAVVLTLQVASALPVVGLLMVPACFALIALSIAPTMLAVVGVVHGEREWLPRLAIRATRAHPMRLAGTAIVGGVVAVAVALPLVLVALVVGMVLGVAGSLGVGMAAASFLPGWACVAVALWRDVDPGLGVAPARPAAEPAPQGIYARPSATLAPAGPALSWTEGPSWDAALEPGAPWGTWIRLEAAAHAAFRVTWTGADVPDLSLGSEDGAWISPPGLRQSGDTAQVELGPGNTYVQLVARGRAAQSVSVVMLVGVAQAA